jgi:hypothetical protein
MSKLKIIGWISWISAGLLLGFQSISLFMGIADGVAWKNLALNDVVDEDLFHWINNIPWTNVQQAADYVVNMPLYLLLFCFGLLCFLLNGLSSKS